jgi:Domain of unknown function (DUF4386)
MEGEKRTAQVVGALFIVATVASIAGSVVLGSVLDGDDYLRRLDAHTGQVTLAVALFLVAATSAFATAFLLYPILRRHAEGLAAGYIGLRAFENVFYVAGTMGLLIMLTLSQGETLSSAGATDVVVLGAALAAVHSWAVLLGTLIFAGLGSMVLNTILFQSRLVPRWLSGWGLLGAAGVFTYGVAGLFGYDTGLGSPLMLLAMPLALQEMVFAAWLLVKGLEPRERRLTPTAPPHVPVAA